MDLPSSFIFGDGVSHEVDARSTQADDGSRMNPHSAGAEPLKTQTQLHHPVPQRQLPTPEDLHLAQTLSQMQAHAATNAGWRVGMVSPQAPREQVMPPPPDVPQRPATRQQHGVGGLTTHAQGSPVQMSQQALGAQAMAQNQLVTEHPQVPTAQAIPSGVHGFPEHLPPRTSSAQIAAQAPRGPERLTAQPQPQRAVQTP